MGFMNLGLPEMVFIFVLALLIFGPKKLPEIGRQIGRALNEFKRASNEFKAQIESEITNLDVVNTRAELEKAKQTIMAPLETLRPPTGAIANTEVNQLPAAPEGVTHEVPPQEVSPEVNTVAKAPDA